MNGEDRKWVNAGIGCLALGALMAVASRKQRWFALGGLMGAGIVGYRIYRRKDEIAGTGTVVAAATKQMMHEKPEFERLGAPENPAVETPNVGHGSLNTREEVAGYPVMFRVPDAEINIDTMDERIRPHFTGPLGPANDPVRHW